MIIFQASNEDQLKGVNIVKKAIRQPISTIIRNAGIEASQIVEKVSPS